MKKISKAVICLILVVAFSFTALAAVSGDINSDGKVNPLDSVILARYLANWQGYDKLVDLGAADVNSDTAVNPKDAVILARHLANWQGYEALPLGSTQTEPEPEYIPGNW